MWPRTYNFSQRRKSLSQLDGASARPADAVPLGWFTSPQRNANPAIPTNSRCPQPVRHCSRTLAAQLAKGSDCHTAGNCPGERLLSSDVAIPPALDRPSALFRSRERCPCSEGSFWRVSRNLYEFLAHIEASTIAHRSVGSIQRGQQQGSEKKCLRSGKRITSRHSRHSLRERTCSRGARARFIVLQKLRWRVIRSCIAASVFLRMPRVCVSLCCGSPVPCIVLEPFISGTRSAERCAGASKALRCLHPEGRLPRSRDPPDGRLRRPFPNPPATTLFHWPHRSS